MAWEPIKRTEKQWGKLLQEGRREWMDIIMEFTKAVAEADDLQEATEEQREVGWKGKCKVKKCLSEWEGKGWYKGDVDGRLRCWTGRWILLFFLFFSSLEIDEIEPEGKRKANKQQRSWNDCEVKRNEA